jgi:leader peptidase (prepilin peptidase)/N-methyltransferase
MTPQINPSIHLYVISAALIGPLSYVSAKVQQRYTGQAPRPWLCTGLIAAIAVMAAMAERDMPMLVSALVLGAALVTLAAIDLRIYRLPDTLTLGLVAAGLLSTALLQRDALPDRLVGAAAGYAVLAAAAWLYHRLRGRHGLGLGDAKLLAAAGAWLGWRALPAVLLVAALAGLAWAALLARREGKFDATTPLAFGPALAAAIWITRLVEDAMGGARP